MSHSGQSSWSSPCCILLLSCPFPESHVSRSEGQTIVANTSRPLLSNCLSPLMIKFIDHRGRCPRRSSFSTGNTGGQCTLMMWLGLSQVAERLTGTKPQPLYAAGDVPGGCLWGPAGELPWAPTSGLQWHHTVSCPASQACWLNLQAKAPPSGKE